jgi:hypothetical protein
MAVATQSGDNCIELPAPPRGAVHKLIITPDSGGSAVITSAVLYDRQDACDGVERSFNPDDFNDSGLEPLVHQISPELTPTGSDITQFEKYWCYLNQDEQHISGRTNSRLWLKLTMGTGGIVHLSYTIESGSPS